jgi:HlyD family secretion protein
MNKKKLLIFVPLVLVLAVLGYKYYLSRSYKDPNAIRVSGNIEVTDVEVSFKIPGHVEERLIDEGQTVRAGQLVARLDTSELAQEVAVRKTEVQTAQAELAELEAGSRPEEIAQAEAVVRRTKADTDRLEADFLRQKDLHEQKAISAQKFDQARTEYEVAKARWQEASEQLTLMRKGPRQEKIDQARSRVQQAKEQLKLAETRLGYGTLMSPISGVVLSKNVESGEYIVAGTPVVTVGDLENTWVRAYIDETDLGRVKVGQGAKVTTDTYPGKVYEGRINFISSEAEFTPKQVQTEKERVKLVYRVKVAITNPKMELKPGMPADATILLGVGNQ